MSNKEQMRQIKEERREREIISILMKCHLSGDLSAVRKETIWVTERLLQTE